MQFSERLDLPLPVAAVWELLWQVERLAACLPGCVGVQEVEQGKAYQARFEDHVGPYKVAFDLDIVIEEVEPQRSIRLLATGQDRRLGVSQRVTLLAALQPTDGAASTLDVQAEVEVLGKLATLGQFAIKRKAKDVMKAFASNLARELQGPVPC